MRVLMMHTDRFESKVVEKSTRPVGVVHDEKKDGLALATDGISILFCVVKGDGLESVEKLYLEILSFAKDCKAGSIMVAPFVHLSSNIAEPADAKTLYEKLVSKLAKASYHINTSHFGFHKSLLVEVKGHPGSFRYREF